MEINFYRTKSVTLKRYEGNDVRKGWTELTVEEADGHRVCIVLHGEDGAPKIEELTK